MRQWSYGIVLRIIPHKEQRYDTCGDYQETMSDELDIRASRMSPLKYSYLVFAHEFIEWLICKLTGVKMKAIDKFDMAYEQAREAGAKKAPCGCRFYEEPGADPHACYHEAHMTATLCEKAIARAVGVEWSAYEEAVNSL